MTVLITRTLLGPSLPQSHAPGPFSPLVTPGSQGKVLLSHPPHRCGN